MLPSPRYLRIQPFASFTDIRRSSQERSAWPRDSNDNTYTIRSSLVAVVSSPTNFVVLSSSSRMVVLLLIHDYSRNLPVEIMFLLGCERHDSAVYCWRYSPWTHLNEVSSLQRAINAVEAQKCACRKCLLVTKMIESTWTLPVWGESQGWKGMVQEDKSIAAGACGYKK